jgi:hypothetical protein
MRFKILFLLAVLATSPVFAATAKKADPDVFMSAAARIEFKKPKGWHLQSLETAFANRASVRMKDAEFQKAVEANGAAPIFIATKHEEPYEKLNATIQVICRPAGPLAGKSGVEILNAVLPGLAQQFADFETVDPVKEVVVGGQTGARMTMRYTLHTKDDQTFPTQSTIVMVPKGGVLYQFGFSGPPEGDDAVAPEIGAFLATVKFLK